MCGIIGVVAKTPVNQLLYDGLLLLQHRGQDAAGIVTSERQTFHMHKGPGYVRDVFRTRDMRSLAGNLGIAHCRYPTAGSAFAGSEAQPFYVNSPFGIVLGHNGNLTNSEQLKQEMFRSDLRHINTNSDSEVLLNVLAHELERAASGPRLDPETVFNAVAKRAPARARRLRGGGDDRGLRRARVPRPARHPAARHRLHRHRARARVGGRVRERRARVARVPGGARRRAGRGDPDRRGWRLPQPPVRDEGRALPVHLRVRLSRAARLADGRGLGL